MLERRGGREHEVCIVRTIGEKHVMDYRKETRPLQCLTYGGLVRQRGCRVTVVDVEDLDGWVEGRVQQVLGQTHHVDLARARRREIEAHRLSRILSSEHRPTEGAQSATDLAPG